MPALMEEQSIDQLILRKAVTFPSGLPGFQKNKKFVFNQTPKEKPFAWMRSLEDNWLTFPVVEIFHLVPDYRFEADDDQLREIELNSPFDCLLMAILRIESKDRVKILANLKAPLVVNTRKMLGCQVILPPESGYSASALFEF